MKRSVDRILTTHAGSLPRPADLLAMDPADPGHGARVRGAVADVVRRQVEVGLDVVTDGEMSKPSFITYVTERLSGFERSREPGAVPWADSKEAAAFPEFYAPTLRQSPNAAAPRFVCTGPVTYVGQARVQADIENLKAALAGAASRRHSSRPSRRPTSRDASGTRTTRPTRSTCSRSPRRCARSIGPSSTPASCCRSMTRGW